ncbi:hypothetical protein [Erwinia sp.]
MMRPSGERISRQTDIGTLTENFIAPGAEYARLFSRNPVDTMAETEAF